ncbi:unnamed protein product [Rodentolepis nana]|uniref:Deacetylase sirtuin-type domain-containing protein n=1 Tax=Rodentolepis nana TaxID=102285 RepID=A0A0R3TK28_RODNA|nr:unnamed protein product [Rodentolepis nana]
MPSGDLAVFKELLSKARHDLATPEAFRDNPSLVWEFYHYRRVLVSSKTPNSGHYALMELENLLTSANRNFTLATQNVDGFHSSIGSKNIIELHGNLFKVRCTKCGKVAENHANPICPALAGRGYAYLNALNRNNFVNRKSAWFLDCCYLQYPK